MSSVMYVMFRAYSLKAGTVIWFSKTTKPTAPVGSNVLLQLQLNLKDPQRLNLNQLASGTNVAEEIVNVALTPSRRRHSV